MCFSWHRLGGVWQVDGYHAQQRCLPRYGFCAFFTFIFTCKVASVFKYDNLFTHTIQKLFSLSPWIMYVFTAAAAAKSCQSCLTLCDPTDTSPPGSPVPGILQAKTLEWVAISFSNVWKWKVKVKSLSRVQLFLTPCTIAHQAPPPMGFSRQENWSGVPLPSLCLY